MKKNRLLIFLLLFIFTDVFAMVAPPVPFLNTEEFNGGLTGENALFQCLFQSKKFCRFIGQQRDSENYLALALNQIMASRLEQEIVCLISLKELLNYDYEINLLGLFINILESLKIEYYHYIVSESCIYQKLSREVVLTNFSTSLIYDIEVIIVPILNLIIIYPIHNPLFGDVSEDQFFKQFKKFNKLLKKLYLDINYSQRFNFEICGFIDKKVRENYIAHVKHGEYFYLCNDETDQRIGIIQPFNLTSDFENFSTFFKYQRELEDFYGMFFLEVNGGAYEEDIDCEIMDRIFSLNIHRIEDLLILR